MAGRISLLADLARLSAPLRLRQLHLLTTDERASERARRVAFSALSAGVAKIISIASAFVSVPLTLHYLGPERYGMWLTISSLLAMLSFADFGIGNGVLNAVASASGKDDLTAIRASVSSGFFALCLISLLLIAAFAGMYAIVPWYRLFNVETSIAVVESGPAIATFACCFALAIPSSVVQRVQIGLQQGFQANTWQAFGSLLGLGGLLLVIKLEGGLPWLILAFAGAPLLAALLNSAIFFGLLRPEIRPSFNCISLSAAKRIARVGSLFFVLQIVVSVAFASDNLIIAQMIGPAAVSQYAVPDRLFSVITIFLSLVLAPLWPAYGEAVARGDRHWVARTLKRSLLVSLALAAAASGLLTLAAPVLLKLWVGDSVAPSFALLLGLGIWKVLEVAASALSPFLNGTGVVKTQIIIATLTGASAIALKLLLIPEMGTAGVVWGTIVAYLAFALIPYVFILPKLVRNVTQSGVAL